MFANTMIDSSVKDLTLPRSLFLHRKGILLCIGNVEADLLQTWEAAGLVVHVIQPTPDGLALLQEIRSNQANRRQLLVLGAGAADLAARHTWLGFWRTREDIRGLPTVMVTDASFGSVRDVAAQWQVQEVFYQGMDFEAMLRRLQQLLDLQALIDQKRHNITPEKRYKIPLVKRIFDIAVAGTALLMLSPLLIIIMVLIKLESRGPIFYISKRVGTGYQIFDFYKFRSMRPNADKMVKDLMHLNQYAAPAEVIEEKVSPMMISDDMDLENEILIGDESLVKEESYRNKQKSKSANAFFKIEKDPRITKVGHIIRNSSIDELPQLINVLKGDMSVVGNRPLPLYEAEQLTTDEFTERFNAPAGITGLWQVTERGKSGVAGDSRKLLDVEYAKKYNIWLDFKILFMTLPAMFQKSDV